MSERTKYWFDTEFMEDGERIELLSIGVVCEDGREFYAESLDADLSHANEWVVENVIPHLWSRKADKRKANLWSRDGGTGGLLSRAAIAGDLQKFINHGAARPEFWAYYGDYDWVVLCQLYGTMMDLPKSWPMFAMDVKQLCVSQGNPTLPEQTSTEHNALDDAKWTRDAYDTCAPFRSVCLVRLEEMVDAELERVRKTDDLPPAAWWQFLRKQWCDGVGTARAVSERQLWKIKSAFYE